MPFVKFPYGKNNLNYFLQFKFIKKAPCNNLHGAFTIIKQKTKNKKEMEVKNSTGLSKT
jgi:hypothetical protein